MQEVAFECWNWFKEPAVVLGQRIILPLGGWASFWLVVLTLHVRKECWTVMSGALWGRLRKLLLLSPPLSLSPLTPSPPSPAPAPAPVPPPPSPPPPPPPPSLPLLVVVFFLLLFNYLFLTINAVTNLMLFEFPPPLNSPLGGLSLFPFSEHQPTGWMYGQLSSHQ